MQPNVNFPPPPCAHAHVLAPSHLQAQVNDMKLWMGLKINVARKDLTIETEYWEYAMDKAQEHLRPSDIVFMMTKYSVCRI